MSLEQALVDATVAIRDLVAVFKQPPAPVASATPQASAAFEVPPQTTRKRQPTAQELGRPLTASEAQAALFGCANDDPKPTPEKPAPAKTSKVHDTFSVTPDQAAAIQEEAKKSPPPTAAIAAAEAPSTTETCPAPASGSSVSASSASAQPGTTITYDQCRDLLVSLMNQGRRDDAVAVLKANGLKTLVGAPPDKFPSLYADFSAALTKH